MTLVNVDVYGKTLWTPFHIREGYNSKIMWLLQKEIDNKKTNCTYHQLEFTKCPPLQKNADGKDIVNISIILALIPMWH